MKISHKIRKYFYWGLSFVSLFVILMTIYFYLGGFEKISLGAIKNPYYSVAGKWLKGNITRKEEGVAFIEISDLIATGKLKGTLCMLDYRNDTLAENEISRFVGVMLENKISAIPKGFEVLEISSHKSYQAALVMHPLVMPNTKKVENLLLAMAKENGDALGDFAMELYFEDNSVIVQMFVK